MSKLPLASVCAFRLGHGGANEAERLYADGVFCAGE